MRAQSRLASTHSGRGSVPPRQLDTLGIWIILLFGACALLPILLATSARPTAFSKNVQAGFFLAILVTALPALLGAARKHTRHALLVYAAMALFSVPIITQSYFYLEWAIGDILLLSVPALLGIALVAAADRRPDLPRAALHFTVATLMVAAIVGSFFPDPADHNRYAAPAPLLMAAVWVYFFSSRGAKRFLAFAAIGAVGVLTWNSQWRSSALVFAFIGALVVFFALRGVARVMFTLVVAFFGILIFALGVGSFPWVDGGLQSENRFFETFQDGGSLGTDSSTVFRFTEANAVVATVRDEWILPNYLLGGGHGATYNLDFLETLPGSVGFEDRNGRDGRVHNIHLGALLLAYRYGLLGIAIVVYMLFRVTRNLVRAGRRGMSESDRIIAALAFIGCALLHLANNVTTNIHFTLTAALLIAVASRRSVEGGLEPGLTLPGEIEAPTLRSGPGLSRAHRTSGGGRLSRPPLTRGGRRP